MDAKKGRALSCPPFFVVRFEMSGHHEASTSVPQPSYSPPNFCSRCAEKFGACGLENSMLHRAVCDASIASHLPFMRRKICEMVYRSRFAANVPLLRIDRPLSDPAGSVSRTGPIPQTPNNIEGGGTPQQNSGPCVTAGARLKKRTEGRPVSVEGDHPLAGRQVPAIDRYRNLRRARLAADGNVSSLAVERDLHRETAPVLRQRR